MKSGNPDSTSGYWSPVSASVDWCEPNYIWSFYVAEFFNTISSGIILLVPLLYILVNYNQLKAMFIILYLAIALIGLGSTLFHLTLWSFFQAWDEVPMLYVALSFDFIMIVSLYQPLRFRKKVIASLFLIYGCVAQYFVTAYQDRFQFLAFHFFFGLSEVVGLYLAYKLSSKPSLLKHKQTIRFGIYSFVFGVVCWLLDYFLCKVITVNGLLHSVWHIASSVGLYLFTIVLIVDNGMDDGLDVGIEWKYGFVPLVCKLSSGLEFKKIK